jgi:hypothetical protein
MGPETDFDFSGITGSGAAASLSILPPSPFVSNAKEQVTWFGTVRAPRLSADEQSSHLRDRRLCLRAG